MPRGTTRGRSVGNSARGGVRAPGGASRGRGPFTAQIPTPPTSDSLITETRNQQRVRQQEELQDEPQDYTRTVGKRKRAYSSIANALGKHKLSDRGSEDNKALEHLYQLGRWIQRGIDLEPDVHMIVKVGIALADPFCEMEGTDNFVALEEELDDYNEEQQHTLVGLFEEMLEYEHDFEELLVIIIEEHDLETFNNLLDEHDARREDLNKLKSLASTFIPVNPHIDPLVPPLTSSRGKSDRGINHPIIAALFCPRKYIVRMMDELDVSEKGLITSTDPLEDDGWEYEDENDGEDDEEEYQDEEDVSIPDDISVVEYIQGGGVQLTAEGMDCFLYDLRKFHPGNTHSSILKGFLQGHILPRVYRAIFLGKTSMMEDHDRKTRASVSKLHGMTRVTPKTIAYAITFARFTMSMSESWNLVDETYDLQTLYDSIVDLLTTPDSLFVKNILAWFNRFGVVFLSFSSFILTLLWVVGHYRKVFGKKKLIAKRIVTKDVVHGGNPFKALATAEAARSQRRLEKMEERHEREEAERRVAEAAARKKAMEAVHAEREKPSKAEHRHLREDRAIEEGGDDKDDGEAEVDEEKEELGDDLHDAGEFRVGSDDEDAQDQDQVPQMHQVSHGSVSSRSIRKTLIQSQTQDVEENEPPQDTGRRQTRNGGALRQGVGLGGGHGGGKKKCKTG
ncbi:hypothetical protein K435DRAFT_879259 [Dendrothele bispora CBS 962.96]|uniref:Uncharacterized protein n=1 Tax=Dendrothele bispora (strain CBS 962.96) TaxID=1314807 RepID=A0A4V6T4V5_DENBC|nr:hypothetical protein K435DRAFT_879259 [Dendrothele bispora CBS 962.96]